MKKLVGGEDSSAYEEAKTSGEGKTVLKMGEEGKTIVEEVKQPKASNGDAAKAEVAAEVADSAEQLDGGPLA